MRQAKQDLSLMTSCMTSPYSRNSKAFLHKALWPVTLGPILQSLKIVQGLMSAIQQLLMPINTPPPHCRIFLGEKLRNATNLLQIFFLNFLPKNPKLTHTQNQKFLCSKSLFQSPISSNHQTKPKIRFLKLRTLILGLWPKVHATKGRAKIDLILVLDARFL